MPKPIACRLDEKGRVSLPRSLRETLGWTPGDLIFLRPTAGGLQLVKGEDPFDAYDRAAAEGKLVLEVERVPGKCSGHPVIAGTRHPIHDIVSDVQMHGGDIDKFIEDFPHFNRPLVQAVMDWYAENRAEIDGILEARRARHGKLFGDARSNTPVR